MAASSRSKTTSSSSSVDESSGWGLGGRDEVLLEVGLEVEEVLGGYWSWFDGVWVCIL